MLNQDNDIQDRSSEQVEQPAEPEIENSGAGIARGAPAAEALAPCHPLSSLSETAADGSGESGNLIEKMAPVHRMGKAAYNAEAESLEDISMGGITRQAWWHGKAETAAGGAARQANSLEKMAPLHGWRRQPAWPRQIDWSAYPEDVVALELHGEHGGP